MMRNKLRGFTILELLVVVAITAIIAVIAIPNFIGKIDKAKEAQDLAEIDAVSKAVSVYYADHGVYPTLQGKDGSLLQPQPIVGSPHNVDFSSLVPDYLATLPHFSFWWVDSQGKVFHTQTTLGSVSGGVFTPATGYSYEYHKSDGSVVVTSSNVTLGATEYLVPKDSTGKVYPAISSSFKNAKVHPESGEVYATGVTLDKSTSTVSNGFTCTLLATVSPADSPNKTVTWTSSNTAVATVNGSGVVSGVSVGTTTITATTVDGGFKATCVVTVSAPIVNGSTFTGNWSASLVGPMTAYTQNGVTVSASTRDTNYNTSHVYQIFDGDLSWNMSWWSQAGTWTPQWVKLDLGTAKAVSYYVLQNWNDSQDSSPTTWVFYGSNDDSTWTPLSSVTNAPGFSPSAARAYTIASPNSYRYYKLVISERHVAGGGYVELGRLGLFN